MKDQLLNILLGVIIGSIFTIITQTILEKIKRYRIKKTINSHLKETIIPTALKILDEIPILCEAISSLNKEPLKLGAHPTFNANVIKSFAMTDLHVIYGKKFKDLIGIIGFLENMQERLPQHYLRNYVLDSEKHLDKHHESHTNLFQTRDEHFLKCPSIISYRTLTLGNLHNVQDIIKKLNSNIERVVM